MASALERRTWIAVAIVVAGAALRLKGAGSQPLLPDEELAAVSAVHYVAAGQFGPTMWYHPNLRNLVLWAAGESFGYSPLALRATSLVLGILSIPLLALLTRLLTDDRRAALVASALLAAEQVHVTFSREAIQETWTTFFLLAGTTAAVVAWKGRRPWWLAAAGVAFGLGLSSKFHAALPLAVCGGAGLWVAWCERSPALAAWVVASLAVIPAALFLGTYVPWFARGYGIADWVAMQRALLDEMANHGPNPMDQTIDIAAWQWFLRPMGYAGFVIAEGRPRVTVAFSNPLVWCAVIPATWLVGRETLRAPAARSGTVLALALFAASYLPLALSPRPIWLLSSLATLPFAFVLVSLAASRIAATGSGGMLAVRAWMAAAVAVSIALYPLAIGEGDPEGWLAPVVQRFRPAHERAGLNP